MKKAFKLKTVFCNIFYIRYFATVFLVFSVLFMFLKFPLYTYDGIKKGMELSYSVLVPSLFPFLVLTGFIAQSQILNPLLKPFGKIMRFIFRLPEEALPVIIMSVTGGYPVGPNMIKTMYENGVISLNEGKRMLLFCMNAGPAFIISTVGFGMLKSTEIGLIIFISVVTSSLLVGIVSGYIKGGTYTYCENSCHKKDIVLSHSLVSSVSQSVNSILLICAWVIIFSCLIEISGLIIKNESVRMFFCSVSEVTTGCNMLCNNVSVPVIAGLISFGGLSTHLQVMPCLIKLRLKYKYFFVARVINASLTTVICQGLINVFPDSVESISLGTKPVFTQNTASLSVTVALILLSAVVLLGENYTLKIKKASKD